MKKSNTPLISMSRLSKLKISKETLALYNTLDQEDLIDISIIQKQLNRNFLQGCLEHTLG